MPIPYNASSALGSVTPHNLLFDSIGGAYSSNITDPYSSNTMSDTLLGLVLTIVFCIGVCIVLVYIYI